MTTSNSDPAALAAGTVPQPEWRCFHCDEVFTDAAEARTHFGEYMDDSPLCLVKGQDGGLAARVRELEAEVIDVCKQRNEYENDARLYHELHAEVQRRTNGHGLYMHLDYLEGEKLVLQEKVAALEASAGTVPSPPPPQEEPTVTGCTCGGILHGDGYAHTRECPDHEDHAARVAPLTAGADGQDLPRSGEGGQSPASCNEWRLDDLGLLDDVAVNDVAWFRMERMSPDYVWGSITRRDGSRRMFHLRARLLSWTHDPEEPAKSSAVPAVSAAPPPAEETTVLQAVLDAITGTLDPHTQIADHPNVKFAQLERLKWLTRANVATPAVSTPDGPLHICQQPGFDPRLHRCLGCHP